MQHLGKLGLHASTHTRGKNSDGISPSGHSLDYRIAPNTRAAYTGSITTDPELIQIVDSALAAAAQHAGAHLACYAGCAVCCFGPFPITERDAERLREGWRAADATLATQIAQRAELARAQLAKAFPGDAEHGWLDAGLDEAAFAAQHENLACPVLDPESGHCSLHESRPIACRLYGLPTRVDGHDLPHCPLCFRRATGDEIEAARAIINMPDATSETTATRRTVIAYAFPRALQTDTPCI